MNLSAWLRNGFIVEHRTSRQEIHELLAIVDRDLQENAAGTHRPEWRLSIAYNAVVQEGNSRNSGDAPPISGSLSSKLRLG